MQIILYKNTYPLNHAHRTYADALTLTGEPRSRDTLDILAPEIVIEYNASICTGYNYAFIAEYGRYYSFEKPPTIENKTMILHLEVDVLITYRQNIMNSQCIAERSSSNFDLYLEDSAVAADAGYTFFSYSLPYEFKPNARKYILAVAGGV